MAKKVKVRKYKREKKPVTKPVKVKPPGGGGDGDHDLDDGAGLPDDPAHPD